MAVPGGEKPVNPGLFGTLPPEWGGAFVKGGHSEFGPRRKEALAEGTADGGKHRGRRLEGAGLV